MITTTYTTDKTKLLEGLNQAANAVCSTMGGQGKTVLISDKGGNRFTKDGVSVAENIVFPDAEKNMGARMIISAAKKSAQTVGDGTTLTTALLQSFVRHIYDNKDTYLKDLNWTFNQLKEGRDLTIEKIKEYSKKVSDINDIVNIAATSANSEKIGELFREIFTETGDFDTKITLERSEQADESYFDITKGLSFDSGYAHPAFMTDKSTEQAIYEDAFVYVTGEPLMTFGGELEKFMNQAMAENIPLVVIAPKFSDQILRLATMNKVNQGAQFLLLKLPGFGNAIEKNVDDIKAFLDADGYVEKVIADPVEFTLFNSNTPLVKPRVEQLKSLIEHSVDKFEAVDMEKRIHRLKGTAVIIYAGGSTTEEVYEEYDRLEDAIGSVKSAISGGYCLGGGVTLVNVYEDIKDDVDPMFSALARPFAQIMSNANISIEQMPHEKRKKTEGIDVKHFYGKFTDMKKAGIFDSSEVLIEAMKNSISLAILFCNTKYILHNQEEVQNDKNFKF